jgi:AraC-like DNA-binding protein
MPKAVPARGIHPTFIASRILEYRYFFLDLKPSRKKHLTVACGGWERCAPDYRVDRSDFGLYGIEYVAKGKGILILKGTEHPLLPGSVFAYAPFTPHSIQTNRDDPLVKYFIDFSGGDAPHIINRKVLGATGVAFLHNIRFVHDLYEQVIESGLKGGDLASRLCSLLLSTLSLRIEEDAHSPSEAHGHARQSFDRCRHQLQLHFRTLHSVSELAELTHFDPAYLSRLFYRFVGEGPYDMLIRLKMNEAAAHLVGGRYSVKEVGAEVGFSDPYHFSRAFKKYHGISPSRFQDTRSRK